MFARVAINLASVEGTFHYQIPADLQDLIQPGQLVTVPFGSRRVQAVVVAREAHSPVPNTRPLAELLDALPVLHHHQLELAGWIADNYRASLISAIDLMLPPGLSQKADSEYTLSGEASHARGRVEQQVVSLLQQRGPLRGRQIAHALSRSNWKAACNRLVDRGIIARRSVLDPPRVSPRRIRTARLAVPPQAAREAFDRVGSRASTLERRQAVLKVLIAEREALDVTWVYAESGANSSDLRHLEELGLISLSDAEVWRDPLEHLEFVPKEPPELTAEQDRAWREIEASLSTPDSGRAFLLHGVTGAGKTEIYLRAVAHTVERGRGALVLVPEIALTPQTVRRFVARFPGQVGLIHSQLSDGERYDTWRRARAGDLRIIVGPRSALFAPLPDIGLLVLDESHDESYKEQGRSPRYQAREVARAYSRICSATTIFGTATPDIVTAHQGNRGALKVLRLPRRILGHRERLGRQGERLGVRPAYSRVLGDAEFIDLPPVRIIDMRQELRAGNTSIISRALVESLQETLGEGQQAILLLNRRGGATHVFCRDCGWVAACPRCERPLTQHPGRARLLCHHCGYERRDISRCPNCDSERVRHFGAGTQRLEAEVAQQFPEATTLRWDYDSTRSKGSHEIILSHFAAQRANVLIGTQMVAKGLDLPMVTLVGVVSADTGLQLPDFRAAERTFQLLTQVAGRAGRGILGGRVILQTYHPDHYAIQAASQHDYRAFYERELEHRRQLQYPPFTRLARLLYRHTSSAAAERESLRLAERIRVGLGTDSGGVELLGPVPCFFTKVSGRYRWQLVLRGLDLLPHIPNPLPEGWTLDLDPVSTL